MPRFVLIFAFLVLWFDQAAADARLDRIRLPEGFSVDYFAKGLANARSMALGREGTLFVGTRTAGNVYALRDEDGDGSADRRWILDRGLDMPNGLAFREGALYLATSGGIWRYDDIEDRLDSSPKPSLVAELPAYRHHGWRYLGYGPDGRFYVSLGAPCNVCDDPNLGVIISMQPDGADRRIYARGVRNSVGFDWDPETGDLWFTDNGRDWLGDDLPPDELNHAPTGGLHFGFPYCHGGNLPDPEFGQTRGCDEFVSPAVRLGPHVASLGMKFYTGEQFPPSYQGQILIAEHGSWNRSEPIGYRITLVRRPREGPPTYEVFAYGWLGEFGDVYGRPVDLLVMPDGSLLVSDDKAGVIYRITYRKLE